MLKNSQINFNNCGVDRFRNTTFGVGSGFEEKNGTVLLSNFGTGRMSTENMIALLNFAGIKREEFAYLNPEHLREIFKNSPINLINCGIIEFKRTIFGKGSRFREKNGATLLYNFGTKKQDTENMIALLNFAGTGRELCDYSNPKHLQEMFNDSPIDLVTCTHSLFKKTFFASSKFPARRASNKGHIPSCSNFL